MERADFEHAADTAAAQRDYTRARDMLTKAVADDPDRIELWMKLSAMCRVAGDASAALDAADHALAIEPLNFVALLMRATQLDALGEGDQAGQAYGRAFAQAPDSPPPHFGTVLTSAAAKFRSWQDKQAMRLRAGVSAPTAAIDRMITNAIRLTAPDRAGPTHYCYPDLPEIAFHDRTGFPWLDALEASTVAIAAEFEAVAAAHAAELVPYIQYPVTTPLDQWRLLNQNRDWTAIHLIERGQVVAANARHCPTTMRALAAIPQPVIPGAGPNAMFSLLAPQTHIPPHTGITNTRLVCHLPLIVPPGCWFRVGDDRREWVPGQAWVFDDTVEHEAMNPSDQLRVILIVDVWHPALDAVARNGVAAVIGAGGSVHGL